MCHSTDSRPPAPPVVGEVADHGPFELTAADGNRFQAYRADPVRPNGRSIVLMPDVRGLHPFYRDLAVRFAEAGFRTVAIDYFGRTAGLAERGEDFDHMSHVRQLTSEQVRTDVTTATALLADEGPVFTVGFCMGGGQSLRQAIEGNGLAGGIGFYPVIRVIDHVPLTAGAPVLLLRGEADQATSPQEYDDFIAKLDQAGTVNETVVYEGAPHSFFDRSYAEWADACQDAWRQILSFTERHS
ncbi:MAG: dienelactone hydrolase family protein [Nonomuraea sp.]|nr:dienelactone hydrolase family protein [Nonomuraea sp.]